MASCSCVPYLMKELDEMVPGIDTRKFSRKNYKLVDSAYALKIDGVWHLYAQIHSTEQKDKGLIGAGTYSKIYKLKNLTQGPELVRAVAKAPILREKIVRLHRMRNGATIGMFSGYPHFEWLNRDLQDSRLCFTRAFADGKAGEDWKGVIFSPLMEMDLKRFILRKKGTAPSDALILSIFIQVAEGLKVLHKLNRVHRDLSLPNIFLSFNGGEIPDVKIGDFADSRNVDEREIPRMKGTVDTLDPLIYGKEALDLKRCDVYSLVAALWQAWHGRQTQESEEDEHALFVKTGKEFSLRTVGQQGRNRNPELQMERWSWPQSKRDEPVNCYIVKYTKRFKDGELMSAAEVPQATVEEAAAGLHELFSQINVQ